MKKTGRGTGTEPVRDNTPLLFLMLLLVPLYGGYYTWTVLAAGGLLVLLLLWTWSREREAILPTGPEGWILGGLGAAALLTVPFAVSPGMALPGALRPVVWLLFFWYAATYTEGEKTRILDDLALEGAVLSLISCAVFVYDRFSDAGAADLNGRLDGFFEYANSWGLYLLVCLILLLWREPHRAVDYGAMAALTVGILLTGSRGVLVLTALLVLIRGVHFLVRRRDRKPLLPLLGGLGALVLLVGLAQLLSGGLLLDRLSAMTLSSSSLNGRLLYWLDGLHMLADHPLGVGRGGYLYTQPLYQTGDYVVRFVHNEYLQMALDSGWAAGLLLSALPLALLFRKGLPLRNRLVIGVLALHAFTDFDFQFTALVLLMLLCGSCGQGKTRPVSLMDSGRFRLWAGAGGVTAAFLLLLHVPYLLSAWGQAAGAFRLWPWDLELAEDQLQVQSVGGKLTEAEETADRIVRQTPLSALAWDCKATACMTRGDLPGAAEAQYRHLCLNPYGGEEYQRFAEFLETACETGSPSEQELYRLLAARTLDRLEEVRQGTGPLADRIADRPDWSFFEPVCQTLEKLSG